MRAKVIASCSHKATAMVPYTNREELDAIVEAMNAGEFELLAGTEVVDDWTIEEIEEDDDGEEE